jgi:hypothetical protein
MSSDIEQEKMRSIFDFVGVLMNLAGIRRSAYASLLIVGVLINPSD